MIVDSLEEEGVIMVHLAEEILMIVVVVLVEMIEEVEASVDNLNVMIVEATEEMKGIVTF